MSWAVTSIGHSNRSLEEFIELLTGAHINLVVDIRTVPRSRANPQFNEDTLPDALAAFDISYEHMAALSGLRGKTQTSPRTKPSRRWSTVNRNARHQESSPAPSRIFEFCSDQTFQGGVIQRIIRE